MLSSICCKEEKRLRDKVGLGVEATGPGMARKNRLVK